MVIFTNAYLNENILSGYFSHVGANMAKIVPRKDSCAFWRKSQPCTDINLFIETALLEVMNYLSLQ